MNWILSPLTLYAVVALALAGSLGLFVSAKLELGRERHVLAKKIADVESSIARLTPEAPPPAPTRLSINLTKRAQALRMHRRGEPLESITAALGVPRNEVMLLLKVEALQSSVSLASGERTKS